jgi:hypothetical protein
MAPQRSDDPLALAADLLVAYRTGADPGPHLSALEGLGDGALAPIRRDRDAALAFWCNLYNAGTQRLLSIHADRYESVFRSLRFFSVPAVTVAGQGCSLDGIEHGILRARSKYGFGYLPRFVPDTFEMRHRLDGVDPRIHFALNCGAASCPPIRAYTADDIDDQLDLATRGYLDATVEYDADAGVVRAPRVMGWYRGDFGGKAGIREFLQRYDAIPSDAAPTVTFLSWDWTKAARKFADA